MEPNITYPDVEVNTSGVSYTSRNVNNGGMNFPARLRELRLRAGLTQEALAAKMDWSGQSQVSNFEHGRGDPAFSELPRLAIALGVAVPDLFLNGDNHDVRPSHFQRIDPTILIEAERSAALVMKAEGIEPDRKTSDGIEAWLTRIAAMYNLAVEDGGRINVDRLAGMMEDALTNRGVGKDEIREPRAAKRRRRQLRGV
jgi:transcriptional regulator with XRE-family HTH domain